MKRIFGVKNLMHILYGIVVLLPMFAILGRVIYTQSNKNAKDSYYGETINQSDVVFYDLPQLKRGDLYSLQTITINSEETFTRANIYLSLKVTTEGYPFSNQNYYLGFTYGDSTTTYYIFSQVPGADTGRYNYSSLSPIEFEFIFYSYVNNYDFDPFVSNAIIFNTFYNNYSYLDNAFEYSINEFVKDNNLGNVDLFSWFTDLFLNRSNQKNILYLNFVNWYLNYTLLVSSGYLIFYVLIWFINWVRKLMDKAMYQDYGGF